MNTDSEENHIKAIYKLSLLDGESIRTTALSEELGLKASSVTDMLKKLADKKLVKYEKYRGVNLTDSGLKLALMVIRKHRLWETFLVRKLEFGWGEVHEIAEQLEHIQSSELINRLDAFLSYPRVDPHGDPIPDSKGKIAKSRLKLLSSLSVGDAGVVANITHHSKEFLKYLENNYLVLGARLTVKDHLEFDGSIGLDLRGMKTIRVSKEVADQILIDLIKL
jgi:DtxR family transcriptional regulator, Mn-dependent transcriptional regulator